MRFRDRHYADLIPRKLLLGALTYMARTASESVGRPDAEEYLEKTSLSSSLAKAAATRAGWSSLIPDAVDTALLFAPGVDPIFSHTRSTGLGLDILNGNPTLDLLQCSKCRWKTRDGKDLTFNEYAKWSVFTLPKLNGVTNALSYLGGEITDD